MHVRNILTKLQKCHQHTLSAVYSASTVENKWLSQLHNESSGKADHVQAQPFVMVLPPPNITGHLHLGHALMATIQDVLVRWHQMQGYKCLWAPGCDHAGISTEIVAMEQLQLQKLTKRSLGHKNFIDFLEALKVKNQARICEQLKRLGLSLNWDLFYFTTDAHMSKAVNEAFVRLLDSGLIYRQKRLINWCVYLGSTLSDIEVESIKFESPAYHKLPGRSKHVQFGFMYKVAYQVYGSTEQVVVATTRPETLLGDTAVAVHPNDSRYQHLVGKFVQHPFSEDLLPIVADEAVDPSKGTGALKVTPAHDFTDNQIGLRHGLPSKQVIDERGNMCHTEMFSGMDRFDCRIAIIEELTSKGLFYGKEQYSSSVNFCVKSGDMVEPLQREQWFLECSQMAKRALAAVEEGRIKITPSWQIKKWNSWLTDTASKDWCISRQLSWGHHIPAYFATSKSHHHDPLWVGGRTFEEARTRAALALECPAEDVSLQQDSDVLDTWFSSALLPFSAFGWPESTDLLQSCFPTTLLETGSDILFFWVARMVMLSLQLMDDVPFREVLLHGTLRDSKGRKMSKTVGNVIDPMDIVEGCSADELQKRLQASSSLPKYLRAGPKEQKRLFPHGIQMCGADALRFSLASFDTQGEAVNYDPGSAMRDRLFCNKLWHACRYVQSHCEPFSVVHKSNLDSEAFSINRWIVHRLSLLVQVVGNSLSTYDLHVAVATIRKFWHSEFCDVYLEATKPVFKAPVHEKEIFQIQDTLSLCTDVALRLMCPFLPFITHEIYMALTGKIISSASYPLASQYSQFIDSSLDQEFSTVENYVGRIRSAQTQLGVQKLKPAAAIKAHSNSLAQVLGKWHSPLQTLACTSELVLLTADKCIQPNFLPIGVDDASTLYLDFSAVPKNPAILHTIQKRLHAVASTSNVNTLSVKDLQIVAHSLNLFIASRAGKHEEV